MTQDEQTQLPAEQPADDKAVELERILTANPKLVLDICQAAEQLELHNMNVLSKAISLHSRKIDVLRGLTARARRMLADQQAAPATH